MSRLLVAQRALTVPGWVKNELWRRARAVPSLDLRFADNKSLTDAATGASLITFTRASSGTYTDSAGVLQTAATDVPRFDHNPTTGESLGLLVEEQRANLVLNSGTLSTQSVTVTAVAHTLSFTGTGTITLTGTSTAGPLVGTGTGESNRVTLTFTPTAGSLTLTVSGTVTNAQLEAGAFRTSYIATAGAAATRSADVASITGANFSSWYNQTEGTVFAETQLQSIAARNAAGFDINDNSANNRIVFRALTASIADQVVIRSASSTVFSVGAVLPAPTTASRKSAVGYKVNDFMFTAVGSAGFTGTTGAVPVSVNQMLIGYEQGPLGQLGGTIKRLVYWGQRLPNNVLQAITQ